MLFRSSMLYLSTRNLLDVKELLTASDRKIKRLAAAILMTF